MTNIDC